MNRNWIIEGEEPLGPFSSYALALWGIQGLLFPNDVLIDRNRFEQRAGFVRNLQTFMRNNGHLKRPKIWAISGQKGGVGKSVICSLLGAIMADAGMRVVIVDAHPGVASQMRTFRTDPSNRTWQEQPGESVRDFLVETSRPNLRLLPYGNSMTGTCLSTILNRLRLLATLRTLDADVVLIDLGARVNGTGMDLFLSADVNVVVSTPEVTSIQNICQMLRRAYKRKFDTAVFSLLPGKNLPGLEISREDVPVRELAVRTLRRLRLPVNPILNRAEKSFNVKVVFNMVREDDDRVPVRVLSKTVRRQLGFDLVYAGSVSYEPMLREALARRDLNLLLGENKDILSQIEEIVQALLTAPAKFRQPLETAQLSEDAIVCGIWCPSWDECELKNPGYACPYKNIS